MVALPQATKNSPPRRPWDLQNIRDTDPVTGLLHDPSGLSKATWTDADFSDMGWHDCRVHAVSIGEYEDDALPPARLLLDLDYIVRWVEPERSERHFTF
ncbi:hypothetical protein GCM10009554_19130 [Kribbella koreensis]|uniref:Uncharacterized protein n=1 Tax=Kribbella koreensis TaxID=57909 RepID=A0ABN1PWN2_9ACTN